MPRFTDEWVIDRVLFDYVSGGSCACCGMSHLFLPNGTKDLISGMTDLETDAADAEIAALEHHPWPVELRDQVWADRVRLRQYFKSDMNGYVEFWKAHGEAFAEWLETQSLARWLQLPRSELAEVLRDRYNIHSAYGVVLCAVAEQVACFDKTAYEPDGRGEIELHFEEYLIFDRRGGFTLKDLTYDGRLNSKVLSVWLRRMQALGGPKLLDRGPSTGDSEDDRSAARGKATPSFASDRRIIRLLIAKLWAEFLQKKYLEATSSPEMSS